MPLISQTTAQRSTFLMHISSSDPSSCAVPLRHIQYLRLKGKFRDVGSGMRGADGGEMAIYIELIFCLMCRFLGLGHSGQKEKGSVCECEFSCWMFYQGGCVPA